MTSSLERHSPSLIHGVFNPTNDALAAFKARCAANDIDFGKFSWVGSEVAPEFDLNDPKMVVGLSATLGTLQETFEFSWEWLANGQKKRSRSEFTSSDPEHLRLLSDGCSDDAEGDAEFRSWTIAWSRIQLDTNIDELPITVRDPKVSPGCEMLFMGAEHPAWIRAIDNKNYCSFWLSGLQYRHPGMERFQRVPYVGFNSSAQEVRLSSRYNDSNRIGPLVNPSFRSSET